MELSELLVKIVQSGTEELCYELKWDVDISRKNKGGQAEFIRDVLCLANADPHDPRDRYLVMNAAKGKVNPDAHALRVDDATYQQLIRSWVAPPMRFRKQVEVTTIGDVAVIIVENSHEFPYKVRKTMREDEKVHLQQDECWTRSGSAKRRAESDDFVAMGEAKNSPKRGIEPSSVPNADAIAASAPSEVAALAERVLEAGKETTLIRAIKRVANETVQVWRSTANNNDDDYLQEMAGKVVSGCDWLTMVAAKAIEFGELSLVRESIEGLKQTYALTDQRGLGHSGITDSLDIASVRGPLVVAFPRVYALGAYSVAYGNMEAVGAICAVKMIPEGGTTPRVLVNNPLLPGPWSPRDEFDRCVSLVTSNSLYQELFRTYGDPMPHLCQFDLLASLLTPQSEWQSYDGLVHYPSFLVCEFGVVRPLVNKMVEDPGVFATIGFGEPVRTLLAHTIMLQEKTGKAELIPRGIHPTSAFFDGFREQLEPYLRAEHERRDSR